MQHFIIKISIITIRIIRNFQNKLIYISFLKLIIHSNKKTRFDLNLSIPKDTTS